MSFTHFYLNPGESKTITVDGRAYTLGFNADQVMLEADEPFTGEIRKDVTLYRNGLVFQLDREDEHVSVRVFSRAGITKTW